MEFVHVRVTVHADRLRAWEQLSADEQTSTQAELVALASVYASTPCMWLRCPACGAHARTFCTIGDDDVPARLEAEPDRFALLEAEIADRMREGATELPAAELAALAQAQATLEEARDRRE